MTAVKFLNGKDFEKMLLEKLEDNFTEMEVYELLKSWAEEKNNFILRTSKKKQDAV
jgi:hypothetical protein